MKEHIQIRNVKPRIQYIADGLGNSFDFPFSIFSRDDIDVFLNGEKISENFAVDGVGDDSGGTVTFATAPLLGCPVTLCRRLVIQRTTDFQESGEFRAKAINDELDFITAALQQVNDEVERSLRVSLTDTVSDLTLPTAGQRSDKLLGFDAVGAPTLVDRNTLGSGVSSHGSLSNLDVDDHPQYLSAERADAWIATKALDDLNESETSRHFTDADKNKLNSLDTGATSMSASQIKTAYESNPNTNAFSDSEKAKLGAIDPSAPTMSPADIKLAYESNPDTNAFSDFDRSKLSGIEPNATADMSEDEIKIAYENNPDTNPFTDAERLKLAGVEQNATGDQTDIEIETSYNSRVPLASHAEAVDGLEANVRRWTPIRVREAIESLAAPAVVRGTKSVKKDYGAIGDDVADDTAALAAAFADAGSYTIEVEPGIYRTSDKLVLSGSNRRVVFHPNVIIKPYDPVDPSGTPADYPAIRFVDLTASSVIGGVLVRYAVAPDGTNSNADAFDFWRCENVNFGSLRAENCHRGFVLRGVGCFLRNCDFERLYCRHFFDRGVFFGQDTDNFGLRIREIAIDGRQLDGSALIEPSLSPVTLNGFRSTEVNSLRVTHVSLETAAAFIELNNGTFNFNHVEFADCRISGNGADVFVNLTATTETTCSVDVQDMFISGLTANKNLHLVSLTDDYCSFRVQKLREIGAQADLVGASIRPVTTGAQAVSNSSAEFVDVVAPNIAPDFSDAISADDIPVVQRWNTQGYVKFATASPYELPAVREGMTIVIRNDSGSVLDVTPLSPNSIEGQSSYPLAAGGVISFYGKNATEWAVMGTKPPSVSTMYPLFIDRRAWPMGNIPSGATAQYISINLLRRIDLSGASRARVHVVTRAIPAPTGSKLTILASTDGTAWRFLDGRSSSETTVGTPVTDFNLVNTTHVSTWSDIDPELQTDVQLNAYWWGGDDTTSPETTGIYLEVRTD